MEKDKITAKEYQEQFGQKTSKRKSKYNAVKTEVDGIKFDSKKEAKRYMDLKLQEKAGCVVGLMRQVHFQLVGCSYKADFVYFDTHIKKWIVEDAKGVRTPEYKIKAKQMLELYGIEILET